MAANRPAQTHALSLRIRGIVQGVGFRPFVFRLARYHGLSGWVRNAGEGVQIHIEGQNEAIEAFSHHLRSSPPPASSISTIDVEPARVGGLAGFEIRESNKSDTPTARVSPDLPVCEACVAELFDPANRRYRYPYINCTNCGPRYSILRALPYDRRNTTLDRKSTRLNSS